MIRKRLGKSVYALVAMMWLATRPMLPQTSTTASKTFEVVSIRPNTSVRGPVSLTPESGGRFTATNETVRDLVRFAFFAFRPMDDSQIVAGPEWINSDRFDIKAKSAGPLSVDDLSLAVRAMLEDRFELKIHREMREVPVYNLVVLKDGAKLKLVGAPPSFNPTEAAVPAPPIRPGASIAPSAGMIFRGLNNVTGSAVSIEQLVGVLSSFVGRPVVDKTGLKGYFDLKLEFAAQNGQRPAPAGPSGTPEATVSNDTQRPSIFTAIQEQLGLRLEPSRNPVETVVIDSVAKPSEN